MKHFPWPAIGLALIAVAVGIATAPGRAAGPGSATPAQGSERTVLPSITREATPVEFPVNLTWCTVRFAVDGDTVDVQGCADAGRVRLILVDAPESGACFAAEATSGLRQLLPPGTAVGLERDVSNVDQYGRYLRYVWTEDGLVNEVLARRGFVRLAIFPPDTRHLARIRAAEDEARTAARGRWAACTTPPVPPGGTCDPSYPTVCIPPPPPDLDCADIPFRRFAVLPPDPHHFDGDGNGVGCE